MGVGDKIYSNCNTHLYANHMQAPCRHMHMHVVCPELITVRCLWEKKLLGSYLTAVP